MSAVLLARVAAFGGQEAVYEVLRLAGSPRSVAYLMDITNWIAYDEGVALWQAGAGDLHRTHLDRAPAVVPYVREGPKVGRNEPCPCGSGKKYKKCCGK